MAHPDFPIPHSDGPRERGGKGTRRDNGHALKLGELRGLVYALDRALGPGSFSSPESNVTNRYLAVSALSTCSRGADRSPHRSLVRDSQAAAGRAVLGGGHGRISSSDLCGPTNTRRVRP